MDKKMPNSDKQAKPQKGAGTTGTKSPKNKADQKKKKEVHHIIPDEPEYPQRGNTNPFKGESWVY
jgi:hypothetical protein